MTCFVSADLSPVTMSSCIQSQAGCDLMFTHRETHTCTLIVYTAQFPVPGLDLDLFCHGCCDTCCRVSQIGFVLHKLTAIFFHIISRFRFSLWVGMSVCMQFLLQVLFAKGVMKNIWEISQLLSPCILMNDSEDCHNNSRHLFREPAAMENLTGSGFANTFAGLKI